MVGVVLVFGHVDCKDCYVHMQFFVSVWVSWRSRAKVRYAFVFGRNQSGGWIRVCVCD